MSYFIDTFDTTVKNACLLWARDEYDSYDKWGWAMPWAFDIAAALSLRELFDQPCALNYHAGAGGHHISEDRIDGIAEMSDDALEYFAKFLKRYIRACERKGLSY